MAASAMKSLAGTLLADDGTGTPGAVAVYDANGSLPLVAPSRPTAGLGGITISAPLTAARNSTGTVVDATGAAGNFHTVATVGTSLVLLSEAANNNTKTDVAVWELTIPQFYKAGDNLTCSVSAKHTLNSGTASVKTIAAALYLLAADGTSGATLIATSAQATTTSTAVYTFVVTGTTLTPGARVQLAITAVITETASGGGVTLTINSVSLS